MKIRPEVIRASVAGILSVGVRVVVAEKEGQRIFLAATESEFDGLRRSVEREGWQIAEAEGVSKRHSRKRR